MCQGKIVFRSDRCVIQLSYNDIIYISSMDHNIFITTADRVFHTRSFTISGLHKLLSGSGFIRLNRSFIANTRYIEDVSKNGIGMNGIKDVLPVSRGHVRDVRKSVNMLRRNE